MTDRNHVSNDAPTADAVFSPRQTALRVTLALLAIFTVGMVVPPEVSAQELQPESVIRLARGNSTVVSHGATLSRVSIGQPEVADAVVVSDREVLVNAKGRGTTTLLLWDDQGGRRSFRLVVTADLETIQSELEAMYPDHEIGVSGTGDAVVLTGTVDDERVSTGALQLAESLAGDGVQVMDRIALPDRGQVLLQVRFAEVNRSALRNYGFRFMRVDPLNVRGDDEGGLGAGGGVPFSEGFLEADGPEQTFSDAINFFLFHDASNVSAFIQALQNRGLFKSLAEPNLMAVPGEEASFLAGGEFPYPVLQGGAASNAVTIEFKEFGVRLNFTPELTNSGAIRMAVAPEVSSLDFSNGLEIGGFRIPSLLSRKASTTIELEDGQTFAIAGLIDNSLTESASKVPLLGDIPVLGALFRSKEMRQNRTELLVMVTPHVVSGETADVPDIPTGEPENWGWVPALQGPALPEADVPADDIGMER